jgi:hypothetical protein
MDEDHGGSDLEMLRGRSQASQVNWYYYVVVELRLG